MLFCFSQSLIFYLLLQVDYSINNIFVLDDSTYIVTTSHVQYDFFY